MLDGDEGERAGARANQSNSLVSKQVVAPGLLEVPASHAVQDRVLRLAENVPSAQGVHALVPVSLKLPAAHWRHCAGEGPGETNWIARLSHRRLPRPSASLEMKATPVLRTGGSLVSRGTIVVALALVAMPALTTQIAGPSRL